jgi:hypothetical protein
MMFKSSIAISVFALAAAAYAQSTAFTYQGSLKNGSVPTDFE